MAFDIKDFTTGLAKTIKSIVVGSDHIPGHINYDEAGAEIFGQVTASPAANTIGARLKSAVDALTTLDTRVDGLEALLTTHSGYLDGVETAIALTNTKLDTAIGHVDGIETAIASTNTKLDTNNAAVDTLETLITSTNTKLDTTIAAVDGLETAVASTNTKLDTAITSLQLIDNLNAALNGVSALRVQMEKVDGTDVDPQPVGPLAKAAAIHIDYATDSAIAVLLAGLTPFNTLDLDESEEEIKATAGVVYNVMITNRRTTPVFVRFYNAAAASVTVGTTAAFLGPFEIPANATDHTLAIFGLSMWGVKFDTGICIAATTGFAANDVGAPAANDVIATVLYK